MSDYSDDEPSDSYIDGSDIESDDEHADDVDDSDFETAIPVHKGKQRSVDTVDHQCLSPARLRASVEDDIQHVASIIGLELPITTILLQHFVWNRDRLIEQYLDAPALVLARAGEPAPDPAPAPTEPPDPAARPNKRIRLTPAPVECGVCCAECPPEPVFRLRCGHAFCEGCWAHYVCAKVRGEGQWAVQCMEEGCATVLDEPAVQRLVDEGCFARWRELLLQSYVAAHPHLRFCPHPSCTETVSCHADAHTLHTEVPTVRCGQGHVFCFGCGLDADHRPLVCAFVARWLKSAREDAGTAQWMKANTRTCPTCKNNIEKNGGCNRILCRHCNHEFCWLCMKSWSAHGYNNPVCNAWKEPEPDEFKTAAKQNLDKWLFYFDRFNNHEISAQLDQELCERTEEKMLKVQETSGLSWIEAKFMQSAVEELTKCRVTLKWTYAMAYFLEAGNTKQIFEDIQADLEKAVEELSQLLGEPIEEETVQSLRQRMVDKTVYVRGRHEIVLQDTAEGLAEGRWKWNVPLEST